MAEVLEQLVWRAGTRLCAVRYGIRTLEYGGTAPQQLPRLCNRPAGHGGPLHCDHQAGAGVMCRLVCTADMEATDA